MYDSLCYNTLAHLFPISELYEKRPNPMILVVTHKSSHHNRNDGETTSWGRWRHDPTSCQQNCPCGPKLIPIYLLCIVCRRSMKIYVTIWQNCCCRLNVTRIQSVVDFGQHELSSIHQFLVSCIIHVETLIREKTHEISKFKAD